MNVLNKALERFKRGQKALFQKKKVFENVQEEKMKKTQLIKSQQRY